MPWKIAEEKGAGRMTTFAELYSFLDLAAEAADAVAPLNERFWLLKETNSTRADFVLHCLLALHLRQRHSTVILVAFRDSLDHYRSCAKKYVHFPCCPVVGSYSASL
jgi:hypothetical protein